MILAFLAAALAPYHFTASTETRTAYLSRSRISEDRPVQVCEASFSRDVGPLGAFGIAHWCLTSITPRLQHERRRLFSENDLGTFWDFSHEVAEGWTLTNQATLWWLLFGGYRDPEDGGTQYEVWDEASLKNDYLVPSVLVRRGWHSSDWVYVRTGLAKPFDLKPTLGVPISITPGVFAETGNQAFYELRYGELPRSRAYHTAFLAVLGQISVDYAVSDNWKFYAKLQQFGLVDSDARDQAHGIHRRDLTIFTLGVQASF